MNAMELIEVHLKESAAVKQQLARTGAPAIAEAGRRIAERVAKGGKIEGLDKCVPPDPEPKPKAPKPPKKPKAKKPSTRTHSK